MTPSDELAIGIIGAGSIGTRHYSNLEFIPGNRVVAVCDADDAQADKLASRAGASTYPSVDAMFDAERGLDAVLICVPPGIRRQVFERAAERGVAVFCEKPPADSLEHAQAVAHIVRDSGILCMAGFNMRYLPPVQRMRELLAGRTVSLVLCTYLSAPALTGGFRPWFFDKARSGGPLLDQAIHYADLMRYLVGEITSVHAFGSNVARPKGPGFTVEDTAVSTIQFESGAVGYQVHSWAAPWGYTKFEINGPDFHLELDPAGNTPGVFGTIGDPKGEGTVINDAFPRAPSLGRDGSRKPEAPLDAPPDFMHYQEMVTFLDAVRTGDTSGILSTYADGMRSLAVVLAMNRSIDSGQVEPVVVPAV